jgi:acetylornithine deacetylase/succinyl-diaminopimelate desuccinylase-like protein
VKPLTAAERRAVENVPNIDDAMRREFGLGQTEANNAPYSQRLLLPSLNIRGMVSAAVGDKARNVIPTDATASIDIRLVKGNHPEKMLDLVEKHIHNQGYHVVRHDPDTATRLEHAKIVKIIRRSGYPAARTSMDLPIVQDVIRAAELAAGEPVVLLPSLGGSLPLYLFTDGLDKPAIIAPIANHDDNQHAPDENIRLANLWYGIDLMASLLTMP